MRIYLLACAGLLAACQATVSNESSPYFDVPLNSKLTLKQAVEIPPNQAGVYMQDGKVLPKSLIDQYYPHCRLEISELSTTTQKVEPDTFNIYRISYDEDYSSRELRFAASSNFILVGGGASSQSYATLMYLHSTRQPNVVRMVCQHWEDPTDAQHLSILQMRKAMGDIVTLQLRDSEIHP